MTGTRTPLEAEFKLEPVANLPISNRGARNSEANKRIETLSGSVHAIKSNEKAHGDHWFSAGTYNVRTAAQGDVLKLRDKFGKFQEETGWVFKVVQTGSDPELFGLFMQFDPAKVDEVVAKERAAKAATRAAAMKAGRKKSAAAKTPREEGHVAT